MKKYVVFREDRYVQEVLINTIAHEEWEVKESE